MLRYGFDVVIKFGKFLLGTIVCTIGYRKYLIVVEYKYIFTFLERRRRRNVFRKVEPWPYFWQRKRVSEDEPIVTLNIHITRQTEASPFRADSDPNDRREIKHENNLYVWLAGCPERLFPLWNSTDISLRQSGATTIKIFCSRNGNFAFLTAKWPFSMAIF